jgi:micrococcal nuclease
MCKLLPTVLSMTFTLVPIAPVLARPLTGTVLSVGDGDTIRASLNGKPTTIRLACIDAPELAQSPHGQAARQRLQQLLPAGTPIKVEVSATDRYNRQVAQVNNGSTQINLALATEGHAVVYRQYLNSCPTLRSQLLAAETQARQNRVAFWGQTNPIMPWDFRRGIRQTPTTRSPQPRPTAAQTPSAGLPPCTLTDCNCSDFSSWAEAQRVLKAFPGDPFRLDRDGDGIACESLR